MVYTANWVIIWYLPPTGGTRNSYWFHLFSPTITCYNQPFTFATSASRLQVQLDSKAKRVESMWKLRWVGINWIKYQQDGVSIRVFHIKWFGCYKVISFIKHQPKWGRHVDGRLQPRKFRNIVEKWCLEKDNFPLGRYFFLGARC